MNASNSFVTLKGDDLKSTLAIAKAITGKTGDKKVSTVNNTNATIKVTYENGISITYKVAFTVKPAEAQTNNAYDEAEDVSGDDVSADSADDVSANDVSAN